jgi:hypothetical protein
MNNNVFKPKLEILPRQQKTLWPELSSVPDNFILYGGTAIALHLGHRESIDFDFFGNETFDPDNLLKSLPFLQDSMVTKREKNGLTAVVDRGGNISLSFFGVPEISPILPPLKTDDNGIKVASLIDLAGMKVSVVQKRAEWKDYADIAALLENGISLEMALSAGKAIYKDQFNPQITLKALSYFDDVAGITEQVKMRIQEAVKNVDLRELPEIEGFKP